MAGAGAAAAEPHVPFPPSPTNEFGFVNGPSCDSAKDIARVIAETHEYMRVICQQTMSTGTRYYLLTVRKAEPGTTDYSNAGFGPNSTYVAQHADGFTTTVGHGFVERHDPSGRLIAHKEYATYKFER